MNDSLRPLNLLSATVGVGVTTDGWNLSDLAAEDDSPRTFTVPVIFAAPFSGPPVVHLGLSGFDVDEHSSSRLTLSAEAITAEGFIARLSTWRNSRIFAAEFNWLAIGT